MEKVTPEEIIDLIKKLPDSESHIFEFNGLWHVTQEWLCGSFAGASFGAMTIEGSANMLIDYLYRHIGHDSIVGRYVTESGFPDLNKVYNYCKHKLEEEE